MAKTKSLGTAKRFGSRYGRTPKEKVAAVERTLRMKHQCPYCNKPSVKRRSMGIWNCLKCGAVFTAQAFTPELRSVWRPEQAEETNNGQV